MGKHAGKPGASSLSGANRRRGKGVRTARFWIVTLTATAALAAVISFAVTTLPYLLTSPASDPVFGAFHGCLQRTSGAPRTLFAVSPSGARVASLSGDELLICTRRNERMERFRVELSGVQAISFDWREVLWISARRSAGEGALFKIAPDEPTPALTGSFGASALIGAQDGVVLLDQSGRLLSVDGDGRPSAFTDLSPPTGQVGLSVSAAGDLLAVTQKSGFAIFKTGTLELVRTEAPCSVRHLWWARRGSNLIVSCEDSGPGADRASSAFRMDALSGEKTPLQAGLRRPAVLVPGIQQYVHACGALPCVAPPPDDGA